MEQISAMASYDTPRLLLFFPIIVGDNENIYERNRPAVESTASLRKRKANGVFPW